MHNFDLEKELAEQRGDEWSYGAVEVDLALVPIELRVQYAPEGVKQFNNLMDTDGCASRSPLNTLEMKFNYFLDHGMHPTLKLWLKDNGYIQNSKVVFNDAFIEILSGTTKNGNSMKAPLEAIRKNGLIPGPALPLEDGMTWEQYMNPERITEKHRDLGRQFMRRFVINYEQVSLAQLLTALRDDPVGVAGHGWPAPINGVYPRTEDYINHAFTCVNPEIDALDNYVPFVKRLAKDYKFTDWGYSLSVTAQNPYPDETMALFDVLAKYGLLRFFAEALSRLLAPKPLTMPQVESNVAPVPLPTSEPSVTPKYDWSTPIAARHSVRLICDEEGLTVKQKNELCATVQCESGFNPKTVHPNIKNGKVSSTDYGICQWNDYYHGKEISPDEAVNNPEKAVRLMCAYWKRGQERLWECYKQNLYQKYL
jgi:hypothetical protein